MSKSVVVYITGEDFSAIEFEKLGGTNNKALMNKLIHEGVYEDGASYMEADFYTFDTVDQKFFDFMKAKLVDYDAGKAENVYLISEEEYESAESNL